MALAPAAKLDPPTFDPPIVDYPSGARHSQAWTEHNQAVVDRLAALPIELRTGTVTNDDAAAGVIGEFLSATSGGPVSLGSGVPSTIATLALAAGDYDVWGAVVFDPDPTTSLREITSAVSTTAAALPGDVLYADIAAIFVDGSNQNLPAPVRRISLAAAVNVYLVGQAGFSVASCAATGIICARRVR